LKASGVVTIGYVYTNYGAVSLQSVETSIDEWKNLYGVTGIFLDAMANTPGYESYYQSIVSYAKVTDGMSIVIGNPGTDTIASYVGNGGVDNIGLYENFGTPTIAYLSSQFHTSYPKTEWSFLAHGVATLNDSFVAQASHYVSYLYISSGPGSAPWGTFPTYLDQMAADLAKVNPSAAPSAAPSNANSSGVKNYQQETLSVRMILSNTRRLIFEIFTETVRQILSKISHDTYWDLTKFCFNFNLQGTFR